MNYVKTTWYLARCHECLPGLDMPFLSAEKRDDWATAHETTGHTVARGMSERWTPKGAEVDR